MPQMLRVLCSATVLFSLAAPVTASTAGAVAGYAAAQGYEAQLNAMCATLCAGPTGAVYARLDLGSLGTNPTINQWRCYTAGTLSADTLSYTSGTDYCTRHQQLSDELTRLAGGAPSASAPSGCIDDPTCARRARMRPSPARDARASPR